MHLLSVTHFQSSNFGWVCCCTHPIVMSGNGQLTRGAFIIYHFLRNPHFSLETSDQSYRYFNFKIKSNMMALHFVNVRNTLKLMKLNRIDLKSFLYSFSVCTVIFKFVCSYNIGRKNEDIDSLGEDVFKKQNCRDQVSTNG